MNCAPPMKSCDVTELEKKGGGVALIITRKLFPVLVFQESVPGAYEIICCEVLAKEGRIRFIVTYRTPKCGSEHTDQLIKCISDLSSCSSPCILMGDFNFPEIDWLNSPHSASACANVFLNMLGSHDYVQFVSSYTRGELIVRPSEVYLQKGF